MSAKRKVLIFTDSRGAMRPTGATFPLFPSRIAALPEFSVTRHLFPMTWTTTLDFLSHFSAEDLAEFDHVILCTGIVEWSTRTASSAFNNLYDYKGAPVTTRRSLVQGSTKGKLINNKKAAFDHWFGEHTITRYLRSPFLTEYEGERTVNMYPLDLGVRKIARHLAGIPNLIFINSNRLLPDWRGSFEKDRPANIHLTHDYSRLFAAEFPPERVVDLLGWSDEEIRRYTTDNIHFTAEGSDLVAAGLMERLARPPRRAARPRAKRAAPLISLIVPVYNVRDWLDKCLTSIAAQTEADLEVLLIDDGSTDGSDLICKEFTATDSRFRYIRQDNRGLGPARNTGLAYARGRYVTFVDSDDEIAPDLCEKLAGKAQEHPHSRRIVVSCRYRRIGEDGQDKGQQPNFIADPVTLPDGTVLQDFQKVLGFYSSSTAHCRLYSRALLEENSLRFPERLPHEDWFFTWKALMLAEHSLHVDEPLYLWRDREGSLSNTVTAAHIEAPLQLLEDTTAFLAQQKPDALSQRMADRRSLATLSNIYGRVSVNTPGLLPLQHQRAAGQLEALTALHRRADLSLADPVVPRRIALLIEGAAAERQAQILAAKPRLGEVLEHFRAARTDRERILTLRNAFQGQRCFIIGNGPSLNKHDLSLLSDEYTFAVNSFFLKTRDEGFMPTFYVVEDSKVMEENAEAIRSYPAPFRFFPEDYKTYDLDSPGTCYLKVNWDFYFTSRPYFSIPRFSCALHDNVFVGQTVTFLNMQLAYYMGFSEVYLIGMDFSYHIPPEHKREGNHILSTTDDPNHFHKDYFGVGKTWKDPKLDRVALSYRQAKLVYEAAGRRLANATIGGRLNLFDRVDYDAMLRDPLSGAKREVPVTPPLLSRGSELLPATDSAVHQTMAEARACLLEAAARMMNGRPAEMAQPAQRVESALQRLPDADPCAEHYRRVVARLQPEALAAD